MSRWQFQIPTEAEARATLHDRSCQAEMYHDAVTCERRLQPVTTAAERAANRADLEQRRKERREHEQDAKWGDD